MVLFMGVDPGLNNTGIGVVSWDRGRISYVAHALIQPPSKAPLTERLSVIARGVNEIAGRYELHSAAVEDVFHSVNIKSALLLGQTRGTIIAAFALAGVNVFEYTALQIKQSVVGYGKAEKSQVKKMVEIQLNKSFTNVKYDVTDALACAICLACSQTSKIR